MDDEADLSHISCETCRGRKRRCDRKLYDLPSCSQCLHLKVECQYPESGKRGIPSGYITSVEKRLAETEIALYEALQSKSPDADAGSTDHAQPAHNLLVKLEEHNGAQSRAAKQAAWENSPLTDPVGKQQWWHAMDQIISGDSRSHDGVPLQSSPQASYITRKESMDTARDLHGAHVHDFSPHTVRTDDEEPTPKRRKTRTASNDTTRFEIGVMRRNSVNNAASFIGSATGIRFIQSVYNAVARKSSNDSPFSRMTEDVPGEDDNLSQLAAEPKSLWNMDEVGPAINAHTQVFYHDLQAWSRNYFQHWHLAFPFLESNTVQQWFDQLTSGQGLFAHDKLALHKLTIIKSILSISLADQRQSGLLSSGAKCPASLVFNSFDDALQSIQPALVEATSLESLQSIMSVQLFLTSMMRYNAAARLGGLVTRMMFQMGLHRCPARYSTFSSAESSLRKRIFWSAYCMDRHICQSLGLPLNLRDDDLDVCRMNDEKHRSPPIAAPHVEPEYLFIDLLAQASEIKGAVLHFRHKSIKHREADKDRATELAAEIAKWVNHVDGVLETQEAQTVSLPHRTILAVLKSECIIMLHRPMLATGDGLAEHDAALQWCVGAARSVISTLHKDIAYLPTDRQHSIPPLVWPSFTWTVWISAFVVLYAAVEDEMPKNVASRLIDQASQILKHLAMRGSIWPSACAAAIQDISSRLSEMTNTQGSTNLSALGPGPISSADATLPPAIDLNGANIWQTLPPGLSGVPVSSDWPNQTTNSSFGGGIFEGYDIPFWLGDDQCAPWLSEWK